MINKVITTDQSEPITNPRLRISPLDLLQNLPLTIMVNDTFPDVVYVGRTRLPRGYLFAIETSENWTVDFKQDSPRFSVFPKERQNGPELDILCVPEEEGKTRLSYFLRLYKSVEEAKRDMDGRK